MTDNPDFNLAKLVAGVAGSVVSLRFVQGTILERALMCVGGAAVSYYATTPVAAWVNVPGVEGLVGFLIGLFGMAIVAKAYEAVQTIDAGTVAQNFTDWLKRKWGA